MLTNPQSIRAILFDLDDTLWAVEPVLHLAETQLYDWLSRHAPGVTHRETITSMRTRRQAMMQDNPLFRINLWALRHAALTAVLTEYGEDPMLADPAMEIFSAGRNTVTLFDDVVPALTQLAPRVKLGSVSNGFADLARIGLAGHFGISIAAHQFGAAKPDPAIFHAACDALNVLPGQTLYVGDDLALDVIGAQQAGLRSAWMNRFNRTLPPHVRPDAVCIDLSELTTWLTV